MSCMARRYADKPAGTVNDRECRSDRALRVELVRGDLFPDLLERAPNQTRDVHLRDTHLLGDLRLRQPFEETQMKDRALALIEHPEARRQHRAVLRYLVLMLDFTERLERIELLPVLRAAAGRERQRGVRATRLERLEDVLLLHSGRLGELGNRRRA